MKLSQQMQKKNLEQFEYDKDELVDGVPFLKLKDDHDTIKDFIKEDRIIDAYTRYI